MHSQDIKLGGIKHLLSISTPLIISALSTNAMAFVDRLVMARYSTDAMNAIGYSGMLFFTFTFFIISISSISEVIAGQYNGAKEYSKVSLPIWQMIYFSLFSSFILWPIGLFGGNFLIPKSIIEAGGEIYFRIMMIYSPVMALIAALSGFFAAISKTKIITTAAIIGNIVNLTLNIILVFGYKNTIPAMGIKGSAIATSIGGLIQFLILMLTFLSSKNRSQYNSGKITWDKSIFFESIKIGLPNAIGHGAEIASHTFIGYFWASLSYAHITSYNLGTNIFILFAFFSDGLQKAIIAISANLIGAKKVKEISLLLKSGISFHIAVTILIGIILILGHKYIYIIFNITHHENLYLVLPYIWLYLLADGAVWVIAGIFTSAGSTKFIMVTNILITWGVVLLTYILVRFIKLDISPLSIGAYFAVLNCLVFSLRYKTGKWKHNAKLI